MMIKILVEGGMEVLTDRIRTPDTDNPKGYWEFERVKKLPKGDITWLKDAEGKAIKIISELLKYLPDTHKFKVLFMCRNINEIMASQNKMLQNRAIHESHTSNGYLAEFLNKHLNQIYTWMNDRSHVEYINVNYNKMFDDPLAILY